MGAHRTGLLAAAIAVVIPTIAWPTSPPVVYDAVGLRITENGLGFVESQISKRDLHLEPGVISQPDVLCYDEVGIDQAVIDMYIDAANLEFYGNPGSLSVVLFIPNISLDGVLFANDSDTFDLCPSFDTDIEEARVTGVVFSVEIAPRIDENYVLQSDFIQPATVTFDDIVFHVADLSDTISDLILSQEFVQQFLIAQINSMLSSKLPQMLQESAIQAMFQGEAGDFSYFLGVGNVAIDDQGANVGLDIQLDSSLPTAACVTDIPTPNFQAVGSMGLGTHGDGSMIEVGFADAILNEALYVAWRVGYLCFDDEHNQLSAFDSILEGLGATPGEKLKYKVVVGKPPVVEFKAGGGVYVDIQDFHLEAYSSFADQGDKLLFDLDADLSAGAVLTLDPATNQMLLSIDALNAEFRRIESEVLYSDDPNAEEDLKNFVLGYVIPRMQNEFSNVPVSNSIIYAQDYVLLFDFMEVTQGNALAGMTIYSADDPNLDRTPPETFFVDQPGEGRSLGQNHTTISFDGNDTEAGALLFSFKLDDGAWSPWKQDKVAALTALPDGSHTVWVKARDRFLNEDPTPAVANFSVRADGSGAMNAGCACTLATAGARSGAATSALLALGLFLVLGLRRRRS